MALRYFFNEDDFGGPVNGLDDTGEHFWAGVFRCAAPLALAAALTAGTFTTQVATAVAVPADEAVTSLTPDEDYAPMFVSVQQWHSAWYAGTAAPPAPLPIDDDAWQPPVFPDSYLYMVAPWAWGSSADDLATVGTQQAPGEEDYRSEEHTSELQSR